MADDEDQRRAEGLGVRPGLVQTVPPANVTASVSHSRVNRALAATVRATVSAAHRLPPRLDGAVTAAGSRAARLLQREQQHRTPLSPAERSALLPAFLDDIALTEELTGMDLSHWRDPGRALARTPLRTDRRFGTAYDSIDEPVR